MLGNIFEPGQVLFLEWFTAVQKENPSGRLTSLVERHGQERANLEFLLHGPGKPRQILDGPSVAAGPAKTPTRANEGIPPEGGAHGVQQKAIGAGGGPAFRNPTLPFARLPGPKENERPIAKA